VALERWFEWRVPKTGFYWAGKEDFKLVDVLPRRPGESLDARPPWLIGLPIRRKTGFRTYNPLSEDPLLFRWFASLEMTKEPVLEFANAYGSLTGGYLVLEEKSGAGRELFLGESLYFWKREIQELRDMLELWDNLNNKEALAEHIFWKEDTVQYMPGDRALRGQYERYLAFRKLANQKVRLLAEGKATPDKVATLEAKAREVQDQLLAELAESRRFYIGTRLIAYPGFHDRFFSTWYQKKDLVGPARLFIARTINEKLRGVVNVELGVVREDGRFGTALVPQTLLAALWLQFFFQVTGRSELRQCPICGRWFDTSKSPKRVFCTARGSGCRQKASRIRRKAYTLMAKGKTLEETAQALGMDAVRLKLLLETGRRYRLDHG